MGLPIAENDQKKKQITKEDEDQRLRRSERYLT